MFSIGGVFGLYVAVYAYVLINLIFIIYVLYVAGLDSRMQLQNLVILLKSRTQSFALLLIIVTFLGTPPTLGFFYKMLIFQALGVTGGLALCCALVVNLILLILYLQVTRQSQVSRKILRIRFTSSNNTTLGALIFGLIAVCALLPISFVICMDLLLLLI